MNTLDWNRRTLRHHSPRSRLWQFEMLEGRVLLSVGLRAIDGTGNNVAHPAWGAADTKLHRVAPAAYPPNGSGETIVHESLADPFARANPRDVSNAVAAQVTSITNDRGMSDWVWQWGQFLDHDIDLTGNGAANGTADIPIHDPGDPLGPNAIPFTRSDYDPHTGTAPSSPREQLNQVTSYIDASNVYGSDAERASALRRGVGGRLKTSPNDLLPLNTAGLPNAGGPSPSLFLAGDVRANEQIALTATHTLFVREHNRLADLLASHNPSLTDEQLYQKARSIVAAEMQIITYNEFLPALLGPHAPRAADFHYDPTMNASVANEFSTAFYRFGHSMLSSELLLVAKNHKEVDSLALRDAFFHPAFLADSPENLDLLVNGLAYQRAQEVDNELVDDVRNFLFGPPGAGGLDLASLNIQRGRDHGLPDYNTLREAYGLARVSGFAQISSDPVLQQALEATYGTVDNVDGWVGGLAEDHLAGSSVGALVSAALVDQFTRLRDGDRFFYLGEDAGLSDPDIAAVVDLQQVTLAEIIRNNTKIKKIHDNVFIVASIAPSQVVATEITNDSGIALLVSSLEQNSSGLTRADAREEATSQQTDAANAPSSTTSAPLSWSPAAVDAALAALCSFEDLETAETEAGFWLELGECLPIDRETGSQDLLDLTG